MMRRALVVTAILGLSALLAFPLRKAVYDVVVVPISYLLWALGLFYHALPQIVWWILVAMLILYMFGKSIIPSVRLPRRGERFSFPPKGQVEHLSDWIHKSQKGVYNRWLVANRLGRLAYQILVQRDSGRIRSVFAPLDDPDWNASPELTGYLQAGLQGSFADYPNTNNPFGPQIKTPLDHDVLDAVEFLESKINRSDNHM